VLALLSGELLAETQPRRTQLDGALPIFPMTWAYQDNPEMTAQTVKFLQAIAWEAVGDYGWGLLRQVG